MYKSKLLELIRAFDEPELDRLTKFLDSPYFGKIILFKEVSLLLEHILSCSPDFEHSALRKEKAYAVVFPGEPFIPGKLDRIMSNLLKIVKEFVIFDFSDLKEDEVQRQLVMAKFYRQKRMEKSFHRTMKSLKGAQQKKKKSKDFYLKQFFIEQEITHFESYYNHRKNDYNVPQTLRSLDIFYLVNKLEYTCWLLAQDKYIVPLNMEAGMAVFDQIIASFQNEIDLDEIPLLKVYHQGIQLIQSEGKNDEAFRKLIEVLEKYAAVIPLDRLKELQAVCRNYCILQYNKGEQSFLSELFTLQCKHLEQGYLYFEDGLLPSTMRNVVVVGLRLEKYEWVYQFLTQYKNRIVATNQAEEIYLFNLATYFFAQKKYPEALDCLVDRYEDSYYHIAAKRMELKIYYELNHEILESKINAFKVYIFRISQKVLPKVLKEGNNNFIDLLRQIHSSKSLNNFARAKKLIKKIQSKKSIAEKEWLLEKLEKGV